VNITKRKCLIAYFSRRGNNYVGGNIVNLPVGNTEVVARMIQKLTKGNLFRVEALKPYPRDYIETTEVAQKEQRSDARPELTGHVENMDSYDVIILGYPNWWGTMPMPVFTFLEEYDFSGKTIVPFCTHEGSGLGRSVKDIQRLCPQTNISESLVLRGGGVSKSQSEVSKWLCKIWMTD
jgi:flavodoxin